MSSLEHPQNTSDNIDIHSQESKDAIITEMLKIVPLSGWTLESLRQAVVASGFKEGDEYRVFRGDMEAVLSYYLSYVDRQMLEKLSDLDLSSMRVKDRVATAIMVRFRLLEPHKIAVQKSADFLRHPTRASMAFKGLYNTVTQIWYAAGDDSTDYNFYTKRMLLGGVYSATFLFWLKDPSEDSIRTRAYLSKKLDQVMKIPKIKSNLKDGFEFLKKKFQES